MGTGKKKPRRVGPGGALRWATQTAEILAPLCAVVGPSPQCVVRISQTEQEKARRLAPPGRWLC